MKVIQVTLEDGKQFIHAGHTVSTLVSFYGNQICEIKVIPGVFVNSVASAESPDSEIARVCSSQGITLAELKDPRSSGQRFVDIRKILAYHLRTQFELSYNDIGHLFNRDHTTIISNVNSMSEILESQTGRTFDLYQRIIND